MALEFNKVWAVGRDTYIRFYPNPGFGIRFLRWRVAFSWHRGVELFRKRGENWHVRYRRFNRKLEKVG